MQLQTESGVSGAMIVQPINLLFDHAYLEKSLRKFPGKFVLCALANPSGDANGEKRVGKVAISNGCI